MTVSDGALSDSETFTISINNMDGGPVLTPIGDQSVNRGETLTLNLSATDPDGDPLTFNGTILPDFATLTDHGNGTAVWLLDRSVDTFGNHVDYEYLSDGANEGLPTRIRYGGI